MLKQASVRDISGHGVTKVHGHLVVVTRHYPRFLQRKLIHEYLITLAPTKELLQTFKQAEKAIGDHDLAFEHVEYENLFDLTAEGHLELKRLSNLSKEQDVYLICYCPRGQYCHREILMVLAKTLYGAKISGISHDYETVYRRLEHR